MAGQVCRRVEIIVVRSKAACRRGVRPEGKRAIADVGRTLTRVTAPSDVAKSGLPSPLKFSGDDAPGPPPVP